MNAFSSLGTYCSQIVPWEASRGKEIEEELPFFSISPIDFLRYNTGKRLVVGTNAQIARSNFYTEKEDGTIAT